MAETAATTVFIREEPLKAPDEGSTIDPGLIKSQAEAAEQASFDVAAGSFGTCGDERERDGVMSGEPIVEPRPSAWGGPVVYGLYAKEFVGDFGPNDTNEVERAKTVVQELAEAEIEVGGHLKCAANAGMGALLGLIGGDNRENGRVYAQEQLGADYNDAAYTEAADNASEAAASGRYKDWDEEVLPQALGEVAGRALETVVGEHEGWSVIRDYRRGKTVDQTTLHKLTGYDSFINDDDYEDDIEAAIAAKGEDPEWRALVARHGREALIAALVEALPNKELHQIDLRPAA